jgi:hypothetical protein
MAMKNEKELIEEIIEHLDQGIDNLDPDTLSGIRKARIKALEQEKTGWILRQIPVGWVAAAIIVMIVAANLLTTNDNKQTSRLVKKTENKLVTPVSKVISDSTVIAEKKPVENTGNEMEIGPDQIALVEMLSDEKELELYENMEFYSWIAEDTSS